MLMGAIIRGALSSQHLRDLVEVTILNDMEKRADLRTRAQEVRDKAAELMKRKRFESQFSPQVVARVLNNIHNYEKLNAESICTLVIDIKDSSSKSDALTPAAYAEVVEEVFDIIAACCLKWNITVDKFTGDGAQAFAGSPERRPDDLKRCVDACIEILKMLQARQDYLSLRWQGKVELRFGICEGTALVGFLGKGAMRSFTAIGNNVSLTHRLCAESNPNSILVHCSPSQEEIFSVGTYAKKTKQVKNLKGFEEKSFRVLELTPRFLEQELKDIGRCDICLTPLVMKENAQGIPQVVCPACSNKEASNEANKVRPA
jgi:class 3 adenylate cyclase